MTDYTREGVQGGPSEAAIEATQDHFDRPRCRTVIVDRRNTAQGLAAAYAVDEPSIRADQTQRIVEWLREQATRAHYEPAGHLRMIAAGIEAQFGATTHAE